MRMLTRTTIPTPPKIFSLSLWIVKKKLDNSTLWNEAAKAGAFFGMVSIGCLMLKELAALSGSSFLMQTAAVILWAVEFFGCILLMKNVQLGLRDKYEGVKMQDTFRLGRRAALLSGLLLASAQALILMKMPADTVDTMVQEFSGAMNMSSSQREAMEGVADKLPVYSFLFTWFYCFIYGTLLSSIMSRYVFMKILIQNDKLPTDDNTPDEQ